jgi:hypothetical protein
VLVSSFTLTTYFDRYDDFTFASSSSAIVPFGITDSAGEESSAGSTKATPLDVFNYDEDFEKYDPGHFRVTQYTRTSAISPI